MNKKDFFVPENKISEEEHISPTGKYKLVIEYFKTGKGTWDLTQGTIYNISTGESIGIIQRNYSSFPVEWIENHANGHDYFIGGENYQGQTVIELDTRNRRDLLPEEAKKGKGFCWIDFKYNAQLQLLLVNGCYWASNSEIKFYDFSNPMDGWPVLESDDEIFDRDNLKLPTISDDGIITAYEAIDDYDFEERYNCDKSSVVWEKDYYGRELVTIVSTKTFKRDNNKIVFLNEEVTDIEKTYRENCKRIEE